jgi:2-hydroxycyclohexanecarboxyl-CoA dehydrogenase
MPFQLDGHVALVTGAGQGVGAEIAAMLAQAGASVGVNDFYPERAAETVARIQHDSGTAVSVVADVTERDQVATMVSDVSRQIGPIDILVNNAGVPVTGAFSVPFTEADRDTWDPLIDLNYFGVLECAKEALPGMVDHGWGRIVTIISDSARVGEKGFAVYAGAKAAAAGFSRSLAREVGAHGITCNCISIGAIDSPARDRENVALLGKRYYPTKRIGQPADIAAAVLYFASEEASWVTGQTLSVSGGFAMVP